MSIFMLFLIFIIIGFCYWIGKAIDTHRNIVRPDNTHKNRYRQIGFIVGLLIVCGDVPIRYAQFYYLTEIKRYPPLEIDEENGYVNWGIGTGCDVKCQEALFSGQHEIIEIEVQNHQSDHLAKSDGSHLFYLSDARDEKCFRHENKKSIKNGKCIASRRVNLIENGNFFIIKKLSSYGHLPFLYLSEIYIDISKGQKRELTSKMQLISMKGSWLLTLVLPEINNMSKITKTISRNTGI